MSGLSYVRPRTLSEAVSLLAAPGARAHAGGTDLLGCLRDGVLEARSVVSLSSLEELRGIAERPDGGLRIGALVTLSELAADARVRARYAALAQGAEAAASPQLRNQGTLGGNLCQRPRCWYYRGDFHCARKGGELCYAQAGENTFHAIFGASGCHYVHPSDTAAPLVALGAHLRLVGPTGERRVDVESFFVPPVQDLTRETVLQPGEVLADVVLPPSAAGLRSAYHKVRARAAWDFALAGLAVALRTSGGRVAEARLVLSGVAAIPWRVKDAENVLVGRALDARSAAAAAAVAVRGAEPLEQNGYKVSLVRGLVESALLG